jgi:phage terminase large subunit-like protein
MGSRDRLKAPERPEPIWSTACPDWGERIVQGRSIIAPPLFPEEAAAGLEVFRSLRIGDMAGTPKVGDVSRPWISELAGAIFGAYNAASGRRLITEYFISIAKKNWKSGFAAGVMLTMLVRNWRPSAEMAILAPTKDVADKSFGPVVDMIRADNELNRLVHVRESQREVQHRTMRSTLSVITGDSATGSKAGFVFVDELWEFGSISNAADILREATGGLASRPEGFVIYSTTQSDKPPAGVFKEKLKFARDVRDGRIVAPWFLPVLFEYPAELLEAKAWRDPKTWYITNPNFGASVDEAFLVRKYQEEMEAGLERFRGFLAKHLNVEPGNALQTDHWVGAPAWLASSSQDENCRELGELLARCDVVTIGVDAGGANDWMGLAVIGRELGTRRWLAWTRAWVYEKALGYFKDEAPRWRDFAADGDLVIIECMGADIEQMTDLVVQVQDSGKLIRIGMDTAGTAKIINEAMVFAGVDAKLFIGIRQNWALTGVIKLAERKLVDGSLVHAGQAMMAYCVTNARTESKGNAVWITKEVSKGKIDPLMGLFDAAECMAIAPAPVDVDAMIAPV